MAVPVTVCIKTAAHVNTLKIKLYLHGRDLELFLRYVRWHGLTILFHTSIPWGCQIDHLFRVSHSGNCRGTVTDMEDLDVGGGSLGQDIAIVFFLSAPVPRIYR